LNTTADYQKKIVSVSYYGKGLTVMYVHKRTCLEFFRQNLHIITRTAMVIV